MNFARRPRALDEIPLLMRREEREGVRCSGRRCDVDLRIFSLTFFGTASAFQPYRKPPTAETNLRRDTVVDAEKNQRHREDKRAQPTTNFRDMELQRETEAPTVNLRDQGDTSAANCRE